MLSDKITSFFFLKEDKVALNEKKMDTLKYLNHYKNMFYIFKKRQWLEIRYRTSSLY